MPEGNIVVSAVAVDEHDLVSSVARKNYIVNPQKSYTYTEALEILKDRMKELGMLNADEKTAPNGAEADFSYVGIYYVINVSFIYTEYKLKGVLRCIRFRKLRN